MTTKADRRASQPGNLLVAIGYLYRSQFTSTILYYTIVTNWIHFDPDTSTEPTVNSHFTHIERHTDLPICA